MWLMQLQLPHLLRTGYHQCSREPPFSDPRNREVEGCVKLFCSTHIINPAGIFIVQDDQISIKIRMGLFEIEFLAQHMGSVLFVDLQTASVLSVGVADNGCRVFVGIKYAVNALLYGSLFQKLR